MRKKNLAILLTTALVAATVAGCGNSSGSSAEPAGDDTAQEEAPAEEDTTQEEAPAEEDASEEEAPAEEASAEETSDGDGVVIKFGAWGSDHDNAAFLEMAKGVEDVVPGVKGVELVTYASTSDFWNNLPSQVAAGTAPDLVLPTNENVFEYIDGGLYQPFDDDLIDLSNIDESAINVWTVDGQLYGIPIDAQPTCLLINLDKFKELGYTEADYPKTWDDVRKISEAVSDPENDFYGMCINVTSLFHVTQILQGFGGDWGNGASIDSAENEAAIQWVIDMFKDGLAVNPAQLGDDWDGTTFATGKALMTTGGVWYYGQMAAAAPDTDYIALPIPYADESKHSSSLHSDAIVMLSSCENPELAAQVAAYMARNDAQTLRAEQTGSIPSNPELAASYYESHEQFAPIKGTESYSIAFGYPAQTSQFETDFVNDLTAVLFDSTNDTTAAEILSNLAQNYGTN